MKRARELDLTLEEIGAAVGVSRMAVSQWFNGDSVPEVSRLPKIAEVLQMSLADLIQEFSRKQPKSPGKEVHLSAVLGYANYLGIEPSLMAEAVIATHKSTKVTQISPRAAEAPGNYKGNKSVRTNGHTNPSEPSEPDS